MYCRRHFALNFQSIRPSLPQPRRVQKTRVQSDCVGITLGKLKIGESNLELIEPVNRLIELAVGEHKLSE